MAERETLSLVTHRQLVRDLTDLGLAPAQTVMLHASVRAIGWVVGGPEEYDTSSGIVDWPGGDYSAIAQEYIAAGRGRTEQVGVARSFLFDAVELDRYAVEWMERSFAGLENGAAV